MRDVVVTGMGLVTCLGREKAEVVRRLQNLEHGVRLYPAFAKEDVPVKLAAPVEGFDLNAEDPEDWTFPSEIKLRLERLRSLPPHGIYAIHAMKQAMADAGLDEKAISDPRTGMFTASAGSASRMYYNLQRMKKIGPQRCSPMGIVASIAGTLNFNLSAMFGIQGSSTGFVSACASSGHALGYAFDEIALGRQDRMFVVGAEDIAPETILPFVSMRVLSQSTNPDEASRPFDKKRDGFVGTGGAVVLILEEAETAKARNAPIYARMRGWGQSTDGYHVAIAHPEGAGLARAMSHALRASEVARGDVDYINAHATSTPMGDVSELKAIKHVFEAGSTPAVSSTKALTGHALSLSSVMEAAFTTLAIKEGFMPGSAHISDLDDEAEGVHILTETRAQGPRVAMSNSSGFGGANVSAVFERVD